MGLWWLNFSYMRIALMTVLINLYNQLGAGPRNIALNLIMQLADRNQPGETFVVLVPDIDDYARLDNRGGVRLIKLPRCHNVFTKVLFRLYIELVLIPRLVSRQQISGILAFGNFLFAPVKVAKTVLLHHPYLVDDELLAGLGWRARLVERIKRVAFGLSLRGVDQLVVQSDYMRERVERRWPDHRFGLHVLPNPISDALTVASVVDIRQLVEDRLAAMGNRVELLYVSRFYPHKYHDFLPVLSRRLNAAGIQHRITVTVDPAIPEAVTFLNALKQSDVSIINIGEVAQAELVVHYHKAHLFLFPSRAETFGNPLVEAMRFGLPIVLPDLEYAHAVVDEAGNYYNTDDVDDCLRIIQTLLDDTSLYRDKSSRSYKRFKAFPDARAWSGRYLELVRAAKNDKGNESP